MLASESKRNDALIHDKVSERLVEQIDYDFGKFSIDKRSQVGIALHCRYLDKVVEDVIAEHDNPVIVMGGRGLDARMSRVRYDDNDEKLKEGAFHDSVNLGFAQDYENGTFTLRYLIQDGETVVTIVCSHLSRIKMDLESGYSCMDGFRISEADDNLLHLEANGVEVWCENIEIKKVEEYDSDGYPVGI